MYFNTTNLTDPALSKKRRKADGQDLIIASVFLRCRKSFLTPFEVKDKSKLPKKTPITSIRRSLTTLTKDGLLVKTDRMKAGEYGVENHCWKLKTA